MIFKIEFQLEDSTKYQVVYFTDYCRNQIDRELVEYYNTIGSSFRNLSMKISMNEPVTLWEPDCYESNTFTFLPVQEQLH